MSNDLYFIPIIARALEQKDAEQSLEEAFEKIESLGTEPQYERGFEQFQQFMDIVNVQVKRRRLDDLSKADLIMELITNLATDTFDGSAQDEQRVLRVVKSQPQWKKEYDRLVTEMEELNQRPEGVEISIFRRNEPLKSFTFMKIPASKTIDNIITGVYTIAFATGRLIWEGELSEQDLIWAEAYPGKPVKLAADTGGEIMIRVFAGLESGRIEVTVTAFGDSQ